MHMLMLVIVGLIVLGAFMLVAGLVNKRPGGGAIDGANVFIWVWLLASLVNAGVGYLRFNIALLNELGAFVVIFGIPAAVAWYLSQRFQTGEAR